MVATRTSASIPSLPKDVSISGISERRLVDLYKTMLRTRQVEEALMAEYHPKGVYEESEMRCPIHFCVGQEALSAGLSGNLREDDYLFSHHRSHGHYLAKGGSLRQMFAEFYGKATGSNGGKAGHQEISDEAANFYSGTILVGQLAIAAGVALAFQARQQDRVTAVVFGDGGADEGLVWETLNFAGLKSLPLVFMCENNSYSTYSAQWDRQPQCNLAERAKAFGVPARRLYGNDVIGVFRAVRRAVAKARHGRGPTFLELVTYRWCAHVGPEDDDHLGYRPPEDLAKWRERCPIVALEQTLLKRDLLDRSSIDSIERAIANEIQEAFDFAKKSPFPERDSLLKNNFAGKRRDTGQPKHQVPRQVFDFQQADAQLRPY